MKKVESVKSARFGRALAAVFEEKIKKHTPSNYFSQIFRFFGGFFVFRIVFYEKTVLKNIFLGFKHLPMNTQFFR
jgi:hypothetical protein